uniref:MORN-repeat protein n=1 Tax=viral metagenome TaxID=1070528 RepID=A0A6C0EAF7_9ZZZZ
MASLTDICEANLEYIENPITVYKKCNRYILILCKLEDTVTNESREFIIDPKYAKYKANKLRVLKIFDMFTLEEILELKQEYTYVKNEIVEEVTYCKTIEVAYYADNYKLNLTNGKFIEWYENGSKRTEYTLVNGKIDGIYKYWWDNGNLHIMNTMSNGILDGETRVYYTNGKINILRNYVNNVMNGDYYEWYNNEKIKIKCTYINEKKDGTEETWYENGNRKFVCDFKNGIHHGRCISYYENGRERELFTYENGILNGDHIFFYDDGKIVHKCKYSNGSTKNLLWTDLNNNPSHPL